jgi:cytochrome c553
MKKITLLVGLIASVTVTSNSFAADAKAAYEKDCAKCHGIDGKGYTKMGKKLGARDYTDATVQTNLNDDAAIKAIKEGFKDKEGKELMKATEGCSNDDAKALVAYMRTFRK